MSDRLEPPFGRRDAGGMAALIEGSPGQIEDALRHAAKEPWKLPVASPDLLAAGAMGGSAISADLSRGLYADRLPRPVLVVRDYRWPACVTPRSLALLSSYSGDTEETLALCREAEARGVPRVALTTGGTLEAECGRQGAFFRRLPADMPPRAALYSSWVAVTTLFAALDWIEDPAPGWREAAAVLRRQGESLGPGSPEARNPAKQLARALAGRLLFVYAARERLGPLATRVRNQLNENAKMLGHSAVAPELNHNEIVGWEKPGRRVKSAAALVLRDAEDSPAVARRLTLTADYLRRQGAEVHEIRSSGEGRIARLASLSQFADWLSFYLALLAGVDPTPIASIDEFKRKLKESA